MDRKKLVLLVAALIIAVGTALVARSMFAGAGAPQAEAAAQVEPQGQSSPPMPSAFKRGLPNWSRMRISSTAKRISRSFSALSSAIRSRLANL